MASSARQPDALVSWMEVLADPTRLRLLRLLERHELGVAEVCHVLQLPQSTVSRHLKVLGDQGWIRGRAKGTAICTSVWGVDDLVLSLRFEEYELLKLHSMRDRATSMLMSWKVH